MSADKSIVTLDALNAKLDRIMESIRTESVAIAGQWDRLGAVGGQRADHAALLLAKLRQPLCELSRMAAIIETQIGNMVADPFA